MTEGDNVTGRSVVLTGWGNTLPNSTARVTAHAVDAGHAAERRAVCGAPLFDVERTAPG